MGIGLTATRDNQLIVGSYNDETKTGGAFVVGNGSETYDERTVYPHTYYDFSDVHYLALGEPGSPVPGDVFSYFVSGELIGKIEILSPDELPGGQQVYITGDKLYWQSGDVHVKNTGRISDISTSEDIVVYKNLQANHSNAMTVYKEGTVTIGHDPIGPMDVVTKQYLENALLAGQW
jgi:hypothetical protein